MYVTVLAEMWNSCEVVLMLQESQEYRVEIYIGNSCLYFISLNQSYDKQTLSCISWWRIRDIFDIVKKRATED
jgi:hypothetical protein